MLTNYVKIAYRTLRRRPGVTTINVLGLALGLAACLLIGLFVEHELSYDDFHPRAENTYRVAADLKVGGARTKAPLTPPPMAAALAREFPEVAASTRLGTTENAAIQVDNRAFRNVQLLSADSSFFSVFSGFTLRRGTPETALTGTNAAVLTASTAQKYFGTDDPMGRTLTVGEKTYQVTGIMDDVPSTSHLQFSLVVSQDLPPKIKTIWAANNYYTYFRLAEGASAAAFEQKLDRYVRAEVIPQVEEARGIPLGKMLEEGGTYEYNLQRLSDIYLQADSSYEAGPTGSLATVYIFAAIAVVILLIACANFMNLATARAAERATEVGIRKAVGAARPQLAGQFLGEAVLTTAGAFGLALGLAYLARPFFTDLSGVPLSLANLLSGPVLLAIAAGILLVGGVAGSYPAFILSRFAPSEVLTANDRHGTGGGATWVRRALVVGQFAISIALIVGTLGAWKQYDYIQTKRLGLDKERVVVLERGQALGPRRDAFLRRIRRQPGVVTASPGDPLYGFVTRTGYAPADAPSEASKSVSAMDVGARFVETMGVSVVAGRSFDPNRKADSSAVMLNKAAAETFGWTPQEAVGRTIQEDGAGTPRQVIGVTDNFHYQSLQRRIRPLVLRLRDTDRQEVYVRLETGGVQSALDDLRAAWQTAGAGPFQYTFLDQNFDRLHRSTQRTGRLLSLFAVLAVVVACLGLFGLATYTVQRRRKEIGIRKALGATVPQVVGLVSKEFVQLVALAAAIGLPVAYFATQRWLQDFAYRTSVGGGVLVGAAGLAVGVAAAAISYHAVQAARTDPATTLRDE